MMFEETIFFDKTIEVIGEIVQICQGIEGIRAKLTKRGLVLRLGLVIWKAVGLRYAAVIYCREHSTSDRDIRYSYDY